MTLTEDSTFGNISISDTFQTVSNADNRSINTALVLRRYWDSAFINAVREITCIQHDFPFLKPYYTAAAR